MSLTEFNPKNKPLIDLVESFRSTHLLAASAIDNYMDDLESCNWDVDLAIMCVFITRKAPTLELDDFFRSIVLEKADKQPKKDLSASERTLKLINLMNRLEEYELAEPNIETDEIEFAKNTFIKNFGG